MEELTKVFSRGLAILKERGIIVLPKGCMGECVSNRLVGGPQRWIDSVNDCLKKRGLNVGQARRMVYDRNELREFVKGSA